ncbi:MAG: cation:proton antiporter [Halobacteriales archaeon SW_9_67_25]|jgi:multicomponent Na+:H+ antiporter subunit B|nr:MAG: cation:proton antiporter [Halobacteriales archaeon SW_9_67_25]
MSGRTRRPYTESTVIMTTVRIIAPFVLTYGLFVMFHGADSSGGGFQGGAIVAAMVIMVAFAFGIEPTRRWFRNRIVVALATGGVLAFAFIGLGPLLLGGSFLEYATYETALGWKKASKYGIEGVELGIGAIVGGVISGLFFAIAGGFEYTEGPE